MSNRKSFLIHIDSLDVLDDLNDEQCGQLFKAIRAFQLDEEVSLSSLVKIAFSPFKNQFIRDNEKYKKTCEARALAGSKGGKQKVANASKSKQKVANLADSDNKNKSKSDIDSKDIDQCFELFWVKSGIKKVNKKKAKPIFSKHLKENHCADGPTIYDLTNALINDVQTRISTNQLGILEMHPTTYLNGERWLDEIKERSDEKTTTTNRNYETPTDRSRKAAEKLRRQQQAYSENATLVQTNDRLIR